MPCRGRCCPAPYATTIRVPRMCRAALCLLVFAVLAACEDGGGQLSMEEGVKCARQSFNGHPGTFSQSASAITYSYETENGPARAIVTFDARRRSVGTFF